MGEESPPGDAAAPVPTPRGRSLKSRIWRGTAAPLGLLIVLVLYTLAGALMFKLIEGPHESGEKASLIQLRESIIDTMWNRTAGVKSLKQAKFEALVRDELRKYEAQLYSAFAGGINTESESSVWDIWGSMVYCATIYTTIGYGHIYPVTDAGRIATIIYSLIGIPLCLIVLAEFGKLLTLIIKYFYSFPRRLFIKDSYAVNDEFNLPVTLALGITALYIFGGALMYMQWEEWDYLEACYFIFISISTVGFGDVLPTSPGYFLASFAYQLFGLALVAMVINVVMEVLDASINKVKVNLLETGKSIGIDLSVEPEEEGGKAKAE